MRAGLTGSVRIYMLIHMRTTLILDDELFRQIKRQAAERNMTLSDIVNHALRELLARPQPTAAPFSLLTYGRSGNRVQHFPSELAIALEDEDRPQRP